MEASAHFRRAIELDAGYVLPRINEGLLRLRLGDPAAAVAHLRAAQLLEPGSTEVAAALAEAEARLRRAGTSQP